MLAGCINDAASMLDYAQKRGYVGELLTDDTAVKPTRNNVLQAIGRLVRDTQDGDELLFHFSGHGSRSWDISKDEHDGQDETIICLDSLPVSDDDLFSVLVHPILAKNCRLVAIFDCCHSGTQLDLRYRYEYNAKRAGAFSCVPCANNMHNNVPHRAKVMQLGACLDNQTAADISDPQTSMAYGAFTHALLGILTRCSTLDQILKQLHMEMQSKSYSQRPQLTSLNRLSLEEEMLL
jgi:hypothetical protein